ncbi:MAG: 50S ribosomal protein L24 [Candidatus Tectomicrobia bacterium]|uniref:Large ribosomal subunit protein uL24 n=1 Tax=Tectimicrobiota bacterium TaxID=2528274 RepID=A0A932CP50_UNCTE|nr:50S ribosomal protein L24 [Candidatus Tectomicrobia bacterium]
MGAAKLNVKVKLNVKKDDLVEVIAGKDKGKRGKVLHVFPEKSRLLVEKVNQVKKHMRPSRMGQQGGIIEKEGKLHLSNVMVVCTRCNEPVRVGHQVNPEGKKVRTCKKCGEALDRS